MRGWPLANAGTSHTKEGGLRNLQYRRYISGSLGFKVCRLRRNFGDSSCRCGYNKGFGQQSRRVHGPRFRRSRKKQKAQHQWKWSKKAKLTTAIPGVSIGVAGRRDIQFRLGCNQACGVAEDGSREGERKKEPAEEAEIVAGVGRTMGGVFGYSALQKMLEKRGSITPQLAQVLHGGRCRKREQ